MRTVLEDFWENIPDLEGDEWEEYLERENLTEAQISAVHDALLSLEKVFEA